MTLNEIQAIEDISVRSYNVCDKNGLKDLEAIINYYREYDTFTNLKNCGERSNKELIQLCKKYEKVNLNTVDINSVGQFPDIISNLTRNQREIVNSFVEISIESLSTRSQNAIKSFLGDNLKIRNIGERIFNRVDFKINDIKNIGVKSASELSEFLVSIKEFVEKVNSIDETKSIVLKYRFLIHKIFPLTNVPDELLEYRSIFKLINFLIGQNVLFDKHHNIVFQKGLKIYQAQSEMTLDEIAKELNVTRERIRQIRKRCLDELFNKLEFITKIDDDLLQRYNINATDNLIIIDETILSTINHQNETSFAKEFVTYLIFVHWSDKFSLVGNIEDVLQSKHITLKNRHNWGSFYLVKTSIFKEFDFISLANDINRRLRERIEETYRFNLKSYLAKFLRSNQYEILSDIAPIAEKIINSEFGLSIDLEDNLIFARSSQKQAYEYAYEALTILGRPAEVNLITKKIMELHPHYSTDDSKVRAAMRRINGFIPVGRTGVFGLKKWESELEDFRGGTIRSIVAEYLNEQVAPKHISEITEYVLQFRPNSNEYSILQNIKLDESNTFAFFKSSFVGLSIKKYSEGYQKLSGVKDIDNRSWEEKYAELSEFVNSNGRLPSSSGCPDKEIKLYRWCNIQKAKCRAGKLDNEKCRLILDIANNYEQIKNRKSDISAMYNELYDFILGRNRLPSASNAEEVRLYRFFYKQRKAFESNSLKLSEKENFKKIITFIREKL